jgi:hypothetical protein
MVSLPDIDKIYGMKINIKVYGQEHIEFYGKMGFVIGKLQHREPIKIYRKILEELSFNIGRQEWLDRNEEMNINIERREDAIKR